MAEAGSLPPPPPLPNEDYLPPPPPLPTGEADAAAPPHEYPYEEQAPILPPPPPEDAATPSSLADGEDSKEGNVGDSSPEARTKIKKRFTLHDNNFWLEYTESIRKSIGEGYELDAGPTLRDESKFLSWDFMLRHKAEARPGRFVDGQFEPFPTCTDFGMHVPCKKKSENRNLCCADKNTLAEYGLGTSLYFKFLKFMSALFLACFILSTPSVLLYYKGSGIKGERNFLLENSPMNMFLFLQAGSWGDKQTPCVSSLEDGDTATVSCTAGKITDITLYYGNPIGYCDCPAAQTPNADRECPSDYPDGPSLTDREEYCCSDMGTLANGEANLEYVDLSHDSTCYSTSAQYIARGLCIGKTECSITIDKDATYSYYKDDNYPDYYACHNPDDDGKCNDYLMRSGEFGTCEDSCSYDSWSGDWTCSTYTGMTANLVATCGTDKTNVYIAELLRKDATALCVLIDAVIMFIFWVMILWLDSIQKEAKDKIEADTVSAKDYTLEVVGLPDGEHEDLDKHLREHFRRVLLAAPKVKEDLSADDVVVEDVNFAYSNSHKYFLLKRRGALARTIDQLEARRAIYDRFEKPHEAAHCCHYAKRRRAHVESAYQRHIKKMEEYYRPRLQELQEKEDHKRAVIAYITFSSEEAFWRCRRTYPNLGFLGKLLQPRSLRLEGYKGKCSSNGYRIEVAEAPEPDDIMWENHGQAAVNLYSRRACTTLLVVAFLGISTVFILFSTAKERKATLDYPDCPSTDYETFYYDPDDSKSYAEGGGAPVLSAYDVAHDYEYKYYSDPEGRTGLLGCMCAHIREKEGYEWALDFEFPVVPDGTSSEDSKWCYNYYYGVFVVYSFQAFAVVAVVVVNALLEPVADWSSNFERHTSLSKKEAKKTLKLFLSTFINTAVLILLISGNLEYFNQGYVKFGPGKNMKFLDGNYKDISESWYRNVGMSITTTLFSNIFVAPATNLVPYFMMRLKRFMDRGCHCHAKITKKVTQAELNNLYWGAPFILNKRYAKLLTLTFAVLLYSSVMPMLYLIACVGFAMFLFLDTFLFTRFYKKPPHYDGSLAVLTCFLLPYAIFLHLCFSLWAFSADTVFPDAEVEDTFASVVYGAFKRVGIPRNFPTFVVWILVLVHILLRDFIVPFVSELSLAIPAFHCCLGRESIPWEGNPRYFDAVNNQRKRFRIDENTLKPSILQQYGEHLKTAEEDKASLEIPRRIPLGSIETYDINGNPQVTESFGFDSKYLSTQRLRKDEESDEHHHEPYVAHYKNVTDFSKMRGATQSEIFHEYGANELDDVRKIMLLVLEKAPSKLQHLPAFLQQFEGHEDDLYVLFANRFGLGRPKHRDLSYKMRLRCFMEEKAPERVVDIDKLLAHHKGTEVDLFVLLVAKYGPLWREQLQEIYEAYDPEKLPKVDEHIETYKGREQELFKMLNAKFGPVKKYPYEEEFDRNKLSIDSASLSFFDDEFGEHSEAEEAAFEAKQHAVGSKEDWEKHYDEYYGYDYYHNMVTGETSWEVPAALGGAAAAPSPAPSPNTGSIDYGSSALPADWEEAHTEDGYLYYHNTVTGEQSWEKPLTASAASAATAEEPLPENWEVAYTEEGYAYYHNAVTGEQSWEKPQADASEELDFGEEY